MIILRILWLGLHRLYASILQMRNWGSEVCVLLHIVQLMRDLRIHLHFSDSEFHVLIKEFPFHFACWLAEAGIPLLKSLVCFLWPQKEFPVGWPGAEKKIRAGQSWATAGRMFSFLLEISSSGKADLMAGICLSTKETVKLCWKEVLPFYFRFLCFCIFLT